MVSKLILTVEDVAIIDHSLALLPKLVHDNGIVLKQKRGYKAGKLSATRNWCQLVDGDVPLRTSFPNSRGQVKTWKLFARFDTRQPLSWSWDRTNHYERKKGMWMIAGDDVWGVAYEDIKEWAKCITSKQLLETLANDLQVSLSYSRQRYC